MNVVYRPDRFDHAQLAKDVLQANPVLYTKISAACEIEEFQVPQSLTEVIRFLNLIAVSETVLTPSKFLDHVWHEFILCTRAYWSFCERNFGRMIHHLSRDAHRLVLVGKLFSKQGYGIAYPIGSNLRKEVNVALLELMEGDSSLYRQLSERWFGVQ